MHVRRARSLRLHCWTPQWSWRSRTSSSPRWHLLDRAAVLYEAKHDNAGLAHVYVNMGPLYGMLDELEKGISFSLKAEALAKDSAGRS